MVQPISNEALKEMIRVRSTVGTAPIASYRECDKSFVTTYKQTITLTLEDFDAVFERLKLAERVCECGIASWKDDGFELIRAYNAWSSACKDEGVKP